MNGGMCTQDAHTCLSSFIQSESECNHKFYWNYFIDKLMFALRIRHPHSHFTCTHLLCSFAAWKTVFKRHFRRHQRPKYLVTRFQWVNYDCFVCIGMLLPFVVVWVGSVGEKGWMYWVRDNILRHLLCMLCTFCVPLVLYGGGRIWSFVVIATVSSLKTVPIYI